MLSFMDIMKSYPGNQDVFNAIKKDYAKLIPFVGAGMSVPCYPMWPNALKTLAKDIYDREAKHNILNMLKEKPPKLLEVAQGLEDCWGERGMEDRLLSLFASSHIEEHRIELPQQSVWLLPYLFPDRPVVTTNFDRVLESVYQAQGKAFDTIILPGRQQLHDQLHQGQRHGLLKIHGDIGDETLEYSSIIFTKRQYDQAYQPDSPVVKDLQQWFSSKMLFFLGCSLDIDQTMELLQRIVTLHKGITHYAIVECKNKSNRSKMARVRELGDKLGIRVILYPKGKHEAVRIILEKLLEDTNPKKYQTLEYFASALPLEGTSTSFSYKAGITDFLGREAEMEQLRAFCLDSNDAFRWWAVTAPGGAGKSRLAYEFTNEMKQKGWKVHWPQILDEDSLAPLNTTEANTLVIVDYVQAYAQQVGKWMEHLAGQNRACPIRILLLERDGSSLANSSWGSVLQEKMMRADGAQSLYWKQEFLQLSPLQDAHLLEVMRQYASRKRKTLYSPHDTNLLDALKRIDPDLHRPLYALFITDAWANGDRPEQWSQEQILQYVLNREQVYFQEKCKSLLGNNVKLQTILQEIRIAATIWGDLTLEQLQTEYSDLWDRFQTQVESVSCVESEEDLLRQLGMYDGKMISALRPDLVGEYFVLTYIKKKTDKIHLLFLNDWGEKQKILQFSLRILLDYRKEVEQVDIFWEYFFRFNSTKVQYHYLYTMILANIIAINPKYCKQVKKILEKEEQQWKKDVVIVQMYAGGLVNLSIKQSLKEAVQSIKELERLTKEYSGDKDIVLQYAKGLVNLSNKQSVEEAVQSIEKIERVTEEYKGDKDIALTYAQGLFNLSCDQPVEEAVQSIEKLETLAEEYSGDQKIALRYAQGLINLIDKQPAEDVAESIEKLERLTKKYRENKDIAFAYAQGLVSLPFDQPVEEATKSIKKLEDLTEQHRGDQEIALTYAQGLVNLIIKQPVKERTKNVEKLRALAKTYKEIAEIIYIYATGMFGLANLLPSIKELLKISENDPLAKKIEKIKEKAQDAAVFEKMCAEVENEK